MNLFQDHEHHFKPHFESLEISVSKLKDLYFQQRNFLFQPKYRPFLIVIQCECGNVVFCHTRLHLGFSANLRIWQVPVCKMEPWSGNISWKKTTHLTIWIFLFDYLPRYPQMECAVSPPWLLKHLRILCDIPTLDWTYHDFFFEYLFFHVSA